MLRITEEIILLIMDTEKGDIRLALSAHSRAIVVAGAVLMDLALEDRIDTDLQQLVVTDPTPLGDDLLDPILAEIERAAAVRDTAYWIERTARRSDDIRGKALARLTACGILEADTSGLVFLSRRVARAHRYPAVGGKADEEVQFRIMRAIFSDEIPDARDLVIISLAAACGVFESMLTRDELAEVRERIDLISGLDLIGRTVAAALRRIEPPRARAAARPAAEIPEAPGWPVAGNVVGMARDLRGVLTAGYRRLGPIFRIRAFNRRYIAMVGAEANQFMAGAGNNHFRSYETWVDFNLATGAVGTMMGLDGTEHLRVRKLQTQAYSPKLIEGRLGEVIDITRREIAGWPPGQAIGGQHAMQRIIAEQIGLLATGMSPGPYLDDLIYFLDTLLSTRVVRLRPKLLTGLPRFRRAARRVRELHAELLAAHGPERRSGSRRDFIDDLLELHRAEPHLFPETDLPTTMLGPYFAGLDTSASTCAFMLYALLSHPKLLARVVEEADALFAGGTPTLQGLRGLDVTHRIALETLRMYPIAPGLARTAANSFEFGGYTVPAGARVIVGTTVTHHLAEHFPEPQRFDIDRYGRERAEHRRPGAYAPFGLGRHRCLGNSLAQLQIAITLATIVREVDLVLDRPHRPLKIKQVPVLHPAGSFRFRVVGRRR